MKKQLTAEEIVAIRKLLSGNKATTSLELVRESKKPAVKKSAKAPKRKIDGLTDTQFHNVRRTTDNLARFGFITAEEKAIMRRALTVVVKTNEEIRSNLREVAANLSRRATVKKRQETAKRLLAEAKKILRGKKAA